MLPSIALPMLFAIAAAPQPIAGLWKNPTGSAIIAIGPCGRSLCGKVVWASERGQKEVAATTDHVVGTIVLTDVRPRSNGWSGKLFIPDDNIHVSARLQRVNAGELRLTGCMMMSLICRSQVWTRTDEPVRVAD